MKKGRIGGMVAAPLVWRSRGMPGRKMGGRTKTKELTKPKI